jgi:putative phosphoribosyl transferase
MRFHDRRDAGRRLGARLKHEALVDPIVLALPRGGVPVGFEIARALGAPLDVFVARKVGAPSHPEYGIGAVAEGNSMIMDGEAVRALSLSRGDFERLAATEQIELERRVRRYRHGRQLPSVTGRTVVLVDDGVATGVTAEAALRGLAAAKPERLVLAVPACAPNATARLRSVVDDVFCLHAPDEFQAVGQWYERFDQTTDEEVDRLLRMCASAGGVTAV